MVDIPINDVTPRNRYVATAGQTVFDYDFVIFDADHIRVQETDPADLNAPATLVRGVDYNVTGVGDENGGTIELLNGAYPTGAAEDDIYTLTRVMAYERQNDYQFSGDFESSDVNADFDVCIMLTQQLNRLLRGSARLDDTDELTSLPIKIENAARRSSRVLAFNADGDGLETGPTSGEIETVSENIADINTVAASIASVNAVAGDITNVNTVASNIGSVNTVAGAIANVNTVATNIANVNTVAGISANVTTVAGIAADVQAVAAISAAVSTVAANDTNVTTVATNIADVQTVAANMAAVIVVANNIDAVDDVATDITNVNTVAANITDVNTVGQNIADVQAVADALADAIAAGISYNNGTSGLTATNVQTAIDELASEKFDKTDVIDEDDMASNSDTKVPTQQSVKAYVDGKMVITAAQSVSGLSAANFTGIPSWVKKITGSLVGVSMSTTGILAVQIGSGSYDTSGYFCKASALTASGVSTVDSGSGFPLANAGDTAVMHGSFTLTRVDAAGEVWTFTSNVARSDTTTNNVGAGSNTITGAMDQLRVIPLGGGTLDAGTINIIYEG